LFHKRRQGNHPFWQEARRRLGLQEGLRDRSQSSCLPGSEARSRLIVPNLPGIAFYESPTIRAEHVRDCCRLLLTPSGTEAHHADSRPYRTGLILLSVLAAGTNGTNAEHLVTLVFHGGPSPSITRERQPHCPRCPRRSRYTE